MGLNAVSNVKHLARQTNTNSRRQNINHKHFHREKYASPGRFLASTLLKAILADLILQYDLRFADGKSRPAKLDAYEYLYLDPTVRLLIR